MSEDSLFVSALVETTNKVMREAFGGDRRNCISASLVVHSILKSTHRCHIVPVVVAEKGQPFPPHGWSDGDGWFGHIVVLVENFGFLDTTADQMAGVDQPLIVELSRKQVLDFLRWRTDINVSVPAGLLVYRRIKAKRSAYMEPEYLARETHQKLVQIVRLRMAALDAGASVSALARQYETSRQTIMRAKVPLPV